MTEIQNALYVSVSVIQISCFEFVSDFEIRISDLFLISCFGFRTSNLVKMINLFLRRS